jgi:hypothetical protein
MLYRAYCGHFEPRDESASLTCSEHPRCQAGDAGTYCLYRRSFIDIFGHSNEAVWRPFQASPSPR